MPWSYKTNGITQSLIRSFRKCKYQTYLGYVRGLAPKKMPKGLLFGQIGHFILEEYYRQMQKDVSQYFPVAFCDFQIEKFLLEYHDMVSSQNPDELEKTLCEVQNLTEGYLNYIEQTKESDVWEIVEVEKEFKVPYRDTFLRGKIDLILRNKKRDTLWILDHKFLWSRADVMQIGSLLKYDVQCNLYSYVAIQLDLPIKGVLYNIIKKPQLRQKKTEDLKDYGERIYQDTCNRPKEYFYRLTNPIVISELLDWEKDFLQPTIDGIKSWEENNFSPRQLNDDNLITVYGPSTFFNYIVLGQTYDYKQKEKVFPELEGE